MSAYCIFLLLNRHNEAVEQSVEADSVDYEVQGLVIQQMLGSRSQDRGSFGVYEAATRENRF
jgi:hypothetical protein